MRIIHSNQLLKESQRCLGYVLQPPEIDIREKHALSKRFQNATVREKMLSWPDPFGISLDQV